MRPEPGTVRDGAQRADGEGGRRRSTARICTSAISTGGILPPAAPLTTATLTIAGMAMAFWRDGSGRVALSFIGEGGSSLGEWHEAINLCAARRLPAIFCVENNQTALSTPVGEQSAVRVVRRQGGRLRHPGHHHRRHRSRSDRRGVHLGGGARARGHGPTLIETRRRCGCAATRTTTTCCYLGPRSADVVGLRAARRDRATRTASSTTTGPRAIRSSLYAARLEARRRRSRPAISIGSSARPRRSSRARRARSSTRRGPTPAQAGVGVFANEQPRVHVEVLDPTVRLNGGTLNAET